MSAPGGRAIQLGDAFRFRDNMLYRFDEAEDDVQLTVAGSRIALDKTIAGELKRVSAGPRSPCAI